MNDNDSVRELQKLLGVSIDGDFGPKTEAAVKAYQKRHNLVADGLVGPKTWASLLGE
jgi:peptidoglycan hydrolase-like protein with peptidoglycan-binding domain